MTDWPAGPGGPGSTRPEPDHWRAQAGDARERMQVPPEAAQIPPAPMHAQATQQFAAGWAAAPAPGWQQAAYPVQQRGNGQAVAALVLGITSIVFCWWGLFALAQVVLAVVFGCMGMSKASRGASGHGLAVAGLVCGCVGAVAYVLVGLFTLGLGFIV